MLIQNNCYHPYCKETNCDNCYFYKPRIFGIRIPKKVANIIENIETYLYFKKYM